MINAYNLSPVSLAAGSTLQFSASRGVTNSCRVCNGGWLYYADGSGQFLLTKPGRYKISFSGQLSADVAGAVTLSMTVNGEALGGTSMGATLAAVGDLATVGSEALIVVPCGASLTIGVQNTGDIDTTIVNAGIVITREC